MICSPISNSWAKVCEFIPNRVFQGYSLEFARPTMLSIWRSSLNRSSTVPLVVSSLSCWAPFGTTPQHSITSGHIWLVLERQGLPKVVDAKVCPWSKFAERNKPKWFACPPKPMPLGMLAELKFTAHCQVQRFYYVSIVAEHKNERERVWPVTSSNLSVWPCR